MIKNGNELREFIIPIIERRLKETEDYFKEHENTEVIPKEEDYYHSLKANFIKYKSLVTKDTIKLSEIISSSVFSGHSEGYLCDEISEGLEEGYIPVLYKNNLKGRNITPEYYMVTMLKFKKR